MPSVPRLGTLCRPSQPSRQPWGAGAFVPLQGGGSTGVDNVSKILGLLTASSSLFSAPSVFPTALEGLEQLDSHLLTSRSMP